MIVHFFSSNALKVAEMDSSSLAVLILLVVQMPTKGTCLVCNVHSDEPIYVCFSVVRGHWCWAWKTRSAGFMFPSNLWLAFSMMSRCITCFPTDCRWFKNPAITTWHVWNPVNYFTSSDPHHDMLGGGCQVRVVIENMMGRMENLRTLISGFLGLVILVRWALVTMFLSWTTQTGCRIHRTYVSLIGSGEGRHTTHLLKCVPLLSTSQTDWKQSSDVLSDVSSDILSDIFLTYLLTFFLTNLLTLFLTYLLTYLSTCFLTYLLTFFLTYQNQNLTSTASHKKPLCKLYIYLTPRSKSNIHDNFVPVNVIALSASDRPAKRQLSPKMQNACSSTHTHHMHQTAPPNSSWVQTCKRV